MKNEKISYYFFHHIDSNSLGFILAIFQYYHSTTYDLGAVKDNN